MGIRGRSGTYAPVTALTGLCCGAAMLLLALAAAPAAAGHGVLADVQELRSGGCGGAGSSPRPLRHVDQLDRAAARWARGGSLGRAAEQAGYDAQQLAALHVTSTDAQFLQALRRSGCGSLMNSDLTDVGTYSRGHDAWIVFASRYVVPRDLAAPAFAVRVVELVNEARATGAACGAHKFGGTGPVRLSASLSSVARGHALDMAKKQYFEHKDLAGRTPADRVRASGYREKRVGENIAFGPSSPTEVVRGWLASPGHCENIMDPRFAETGIGYASGHAPRRASGVALYWVQLLAEPMP